MHTNRHLLDPLRERQGLVARQRLPRSGEEHVSDSFVDCVGGGGVPCRGGRGTEQLSLVPVLQVGVELWIDSKTISAPGGSVIDARVNCARACVPGMKPTPSNSHASWCFDPGRPSIGTPYSLATRADARDISRSLAWGATEAGGGELVFFSFFRS